MNKFKCRDYCYLSFLLLLTLFGLETRAQTFRGQQEFTFGVGFITPGQLFGNHEQGINYNVVSSASPSYMASYKYYFRDRLAIGLNAGTQTTWGTRADENAVNYKYKDVNSIYTAEVTMVARDVKHFQFYVLYGAGIIHTNETNQYTLSAPQTNNSNLLGEQGSLGIKYGGNFSGFAEVGLGYKGLLNLGISCKLDTRSRKPGYLDKPLPKEIEFIPYNFPTDSLGLEYRGRIKTGNPNYDLEANWDNQMKKVSHKAAKKKANVIKVTNIIDVTKGDHYFIKGKAYYTSNMDTFKKSVQAIKTRAAYEEKSAVVIIYNNGGGRIKFRLNDQDSLELRKRSVFVYKLKTGCKFNVSTVKGDNITIDAKRGNIYYIRASNEILKPFPISGSMFTPFSRLKMVDALQGELESALIKKVEYKNAEGVK